MDKRCKDCIYKGYEESDKTETWAFCLCKDKDLRQKACDWLNYIDRYLIQYAVRDKYEQFPKNRVPSCQLVQGAYSELSGITCTQYKSKASIAEV